MWLCLDCCPIVPRNSIHKWCQCQNLDWLQNQTNNSAVFMWILSSNLMKLWCWWNCKKPRIWWNWKDLKQIQMSRNLVKMPYDPIVPHNLLVIKSCLCQNLTPSVPRKMTPFLGGTEFYAVIFCVLRGESKVRERE